MAGRGYRGPEPLTAQRELFGRLIASGASNSEACRTVGVNRKTGTRWRYGRSIPTSAGGVLHYPPVLSTRLVAVSPRYLSEDERGVIADLHRAGMSARLIATEIGRSPSTVSRELARNTGPGGRYGARCTRPPGPRRATRHGKPDRPKTFHRGPGGGRRGSGGCGARRRRCFRVVRLAHALAGGGAWGLDLQYGGRVQVEHY